MVSINPVREVIDCLIDQVCLLESPIDIRSRKRTMRSPTSDCLDDINFQNRIKMPRTNSFSNLDYFNQKSYKIPQLDGADDSSSDSESASKSDDMKVEVETSLTRKIKERSLASSEPCNEGPVRCNSCKRTYRTRTSYDKHLSSCTEISSDSSDESTESPTTSRMSTKASKYGTVVLKTKLVLMQSPEKNQKRKSSKLVRKTVKLAAKPSPTPASHVSESVQPLQHIATIEAPAQFNQNIVYQEQPPMIMGQNPIFLTQPTNTVYYINLTPNKQQNYFLVNNPDGPGVVYVQAAEQESIAQSPIILQQAPTYGNMMTLNPSFNTGSVNTAFCQPQMNTFLPTASSNITYNPSQQAFAQIFSTPLNDASQVLNSNPGGIFLSSNPQQTFTNPQQSFNNSPQSFTNTQQAFTVNQAAANQAFLQAAVNSNLTQNMLPAGVTLNTRESPVQIVSNEKLQEQTIVMHSPHVPTPQLTSNPPTVQTPQLPQHPSVSTPQIVTHTSPMQAPQLTSHITVPTSQLPSYPIVQTPQISSHPTIATPHLPSYQTVPTPQPPQLRTENLQNQHTNAINQSIINAAKLSQPQPHQNIIHQGLINSHHVSKPPEHQRQTVMTSLPSSSHGMSMPTMPRYSIQNNDLGISCVSQHQHQHQQPPMHMQGMQMSSHLPQTPSHHNMPSSHNMVSAGQYYSQSPSHMQQQHTTINTMPQIAPPQVSSYYQTPQISNISHHHQNIQYRPRFNVMQPRQPSPVAPLINYNMKLNNQGLVHISNYSNNNNSNKKPISTINLSGNISRMPHHMNRPRVPITTQVATATRLYVQPPVKTYSNIAKIAVKPDTSSPPPCKISLAEETKVVKITASASVGTQTTQRCATPNQIKKEPADNEDKTGIQFKIHSSDGYTTVAHNVSQAWQNIFEAVQKARKAYNLAPLPYNPFSLTGQHLTGLGQDPIKFLIEQLPGVAQ